MTIPEGIVISGDNKTYDSGIRLAYNGEGALLIAAADEMPKVLVENIEIMITKSFPLQVSVAVEGFKSVPCRELLFPPSPMPTIPLWSSWQRQNLGPPSHASQ